MVWESSDLDMLVGVAEGGAVGGAAVGRFQMGSVCCCD